MAKNVYVLDTSVLLTDANSLYSFKNHDILIPLKVLEELDKHKTRQDIPGSNARKVIKILDDLRTKGCLKTGSRIEKGKGLLKVKGFNKTLLPSEFDVKVADNEILATALTEKEENKEKKVIVVSRDINMRIKSDAIDLMSENYDIDQAIDKKDDLYSGTETILVDEQLIDRFYNKEDIFLEKTTLLYPNQFVMLVSSANDKKTALARFKDYSLPLQRIVKPKKDFWGVKPRNKEQDFALDLLLDPDVPVVTLVGIAGSGKTLIALAAGLEQTIGNGQRPLYKRMIVSKPIQPVGKDIGFLPGTMEEKMTPWLSPITDNLKYMVGDKMQLYEYVNRGMIEIEAITYIRGRSISDAYIIIDECQNLTVHEIKTILTRVGERTKIVLTGDIDQIDNSFVNDTTNGLTHAVEKLKEHDIAGHVTLVKGERSRVATLCSKIFSK